jgi:hypothetical protein
LKAKLPSGKKGRGEDDEFEDKRKKSNSPHQDDATDSADISDIDEDEEADDDEVVAKKKKNSRILQIVIGAGLIVFLASDYIFPPEEPAVDPASLLKKRPKPTPKETPNTETPSPDTEITEPSPDVPTEDITSETPTEDMPIGEPVTEPEPSTDTDVTETPSEPAVEDEPAMTDVPMEEPSGEKPSEFGETTTDTIDGETTVPGEENLTDQILLDLEQQAKAKEVPEPKKEYVSPPDYEYRGRGLVYNCVGKHWACVDAPSYKACEDNASSVKYLNKKTECYPFNVYETVRGCENLQNRMVSSSAKTEFCN